MQSTCHVDGQIRARSQGLTDKDLLYIMGPAEGDRLYVANKVILKTLCMVPVTVFELIDPLFWL